MRQKYLHMPLPQWRERYRSLYLSLLAATPIRSGSPDGFTRRRQPHFCGPLLQGCRAPRALPGSPTREISPNRHGLFTQSVRGWNFQHCEGISSRQITKDFGIANSCRLFGWVDALQLSLGSSARIRLAGRFPLGRLRSL